MTRVLPIHNVYRSALALLALLCACCIQTVSADTTFKGDLFLFPNIQATHVSGPGAPANVDKSEIEPVVDLFYSYEKDNFLVLIEYFASNDENHVERLQFGWGIDENTLLWFGRFHNPLGFWNTAYHHGAYLQTSISRPAIIDFEDNSGILPTHISGLLLDKDIYYGDSRLNLDFALSASPTMESGSLEAMEIFSPGGETYHENITLRLGYYPQTIENSHIGVFAGFSRIEGDGITSSEIEQTQAGIFGLLDHGALQLMSSVFFVDNSIKSPIAAPDNTNNFINAYLQVEYAVDERWTAYTRLEDTFNSENDPFLALTPSFIDERKIAGLRLDVITRHALTLELRHDHHVSAGDIDHVVLQWSALLP